MSIYFTVEAGYTNAGTVVYLDNGVQLSVKPQVREIKYGDGYGLSIPLAAPLVSFSGQFSNRSPLEINIIETYFVELAGEIIPNFIINGETIPVSVVQFNKNYVNGEVYSLNGEFKQEYR
jgi:hypothetical protein